MMHNELMDLAEKMGGEATEYEAELMAERLTRNAWDPRQTQDIPQHIWDRHLEAVISSAATDLDIEFGRIA